ncbi:MAG: tetratricopeptide repeat protein, partial [Pseudomonadota bacterium]
AHIALGEIDRARAILDSAPDAKKGDPAIMSVYAELDLAAETAETGEAAELLARLEANADDHQARLDLALAQIAAKNHEAAVETLLDLFRRAPEFEDGAAKAQLFKLFDMLGPKDPVAQKGRRRLSSMIFA